MKSGWVRKVEKDLRKNLLIFNKMFWFKLLVFLLQTRKISMKAKNTKMAQKYKNMDKKV